MTLLANPAAKYRPFPPVHLRDRTWPDAVLSRAPIWLSTDLRDGNQALIEPMDGERKLRLFETLVKIGFKQIEVGFPAASQTEFDFVRRLIDEGRIPDDVTLQVMTPAREELIRRSFEALEGAPRAIVHLYNAIAPVMRRVVFGLSQDGVVDLAVQHAQLVKDLAADKPDTQWTFQYSPETFSDAELPFAKRVVDAVTGVWQPTPARPCIINLPTTIEHSTPNIFADMVEWMHRHIARREAVILSIHPHNDRGTGVAAAEFALMAGADRMEGCLFGNGERTGNVDLVNLALNLYTQGVSPGLDFSDIDATRRTVEHCNQLPVHPRHPYAGDLVYTSFSGSHQDAIKKAFAARREGDIWDMPYLPIDPKDLGRSYEAVIRVNSQSGKGGIAYLMESEYGLALPRRLQIEFASSVQAVMDAQGRELTAADIWQLLAEAYQVHDDAIRIGQLHMDDLTDGRSRVSLRVAVQGINMDLSGEGRGPVDAMVQALRAATGVAIEVLDLHEHAITDGPLAAGQGAQARAAAYLELRIADTRTLFGVGLDASIVTASMKAVVSGLLRAGVALAPRRQATLDTFNA